MPQHRVVIVAAADADFSPVEQALAGLDCDLQVRVCESDGETIEAVKGTDVILDYGPRFPRSVIEEIDTAVGIIAVSHGFDEVDHVAAAERGIMVSNAAGYVTEEVANHTIMLLLACAKKLTRLHESTRAGKWSADILSQRTSFPPILGQVLGLVGFGNIARATSNRAKPFGLEVVMHDPYTPAWTAREYRVEQVTSLEELASRSDFVSIHVPLNDETRHLIGESFFRAMKPTAYLINVSRGPIVDERALVTALQEDEIAGAGLDVFDREPALADNPLLKMDNVVVTPHSAGWSVDAATAGMASAGEEAARILKGMWPMSLVNPEVKSRIPDRKPATSL